MLKRFYDDRAWVCTTRSSLYYWLRKFRNRTVFPTLDRSCNKKVWDIRKIDTYTYKITYKYRCDYGPWRYDTLLLIWDYPVLNSR